MLTKFEPNLESIVRNLFGPAYLSKPIVEWAMDLLRPQGLILCDLVRLNVGSQLDLRSELILTIDSDIYREIDLATCSDTTIEEKERELALIPF